MSELVEKSYSEAVKEIKQEWFKSDSNQWFEYVIKLPVSEQVVYMIMIMHNQIFNGGLHQYFVNKYGQFVEKTIEYLMLIGAKGKAEILKEAFKLVNYEKLDERSFREALLKGQIEKLFVTDELFDSLDELDEKYDDSDEDIEILLNIYLESIS